MPLLPVLFIFATLLPIFLGFGLHITGSFRDVQYGLLPLLLYLGYRNRNLPFTLPRAHRLWIWGGFGCLFVADSWSRYFAVNLNGIDFSIFDWMLVNTWRGNFMFSPLNGFSHFAIHPSWIFLPLVPLHALFMSPFFLLTIGPIILWLPAWPLWKLCKLKGLSDLDSGLIVLAYLTTPFVDFIVNTGFRIESFIPLGIFTFLYFWEKRNTIGWILGALLFFSIKEDSSFYLAAFAIAQLFQKETRIAAGGLLAGSLLFTAWTFGIQQPYFLREAQQLEPGYLGFWGHYGATKEEILKKMITSPWLVISDIFRSGWWRLYVPLLLFPLLSLPVLLASLPAIFLLGTAASCSAMHGYNHYYACLLLCFALYGMQDFFVRFSHVSRLRGVARGALFFFPLFHAGWVSVLRPDWKTFDALQQARHFLEQNHPHAKICTQTIGFPQLGYTLALQPYTESCLTQVDTMIVTIPQKDPHPYSKEMWENLDEKITKMGGKRFDFGEVKVYQTPEEQPPN